MASLDTLKFAKESVRAARLHSETAIASMVPNIEKATSPVESRIIELRGFVRGKISGQDDVLGIVRSLVPADQLGALQKASDKVTAPASHWEAQFEKTLAPLIENEPKSQERAKKFLAELAQRVRTLVLWEGILDQLIARADANGKPAAPKKPAPKPSDSDTQEDLGAVILGESGPPKEGDTGDAAGAKPGEVGTVDDPIGSDPDIEEWLKEMGDGKK